MTLESVLLIVLFVVFLLGAMTRTPMTTFLDYGPLLGARVEKQLITGDGFLQDGNTVIQQWQ